MWGWRQAGSPGEASPCDETAVPAPATTIPARGVTASRPRKTAKAGAPELRHREGRGGPGGRGREGTSGLECRRPVGRPRRAAG